MTELLNPLVLPNITLPGRIIRSATEMFKSEPDGRVSEFEIEHYENLARQPIALVISAHTCVMPEGRTNLGQNALWDDRFIDGQKRLADIVHSSPFGTRTVLQLGHGGMKAKGFDGLKILTPDNMTHDDIRSTVEHFVNAAVRAKKAGFDGVQLHGAHGYLLSQFFYPEFNHREDDYGGSAENRFRITMEIAAAIKYVCGDDFPVFLKLNSTDKPLSDVKPCSAHYFSDLVTALRLSAEVGIEAVELSGYHSSPAGIAEKPYFFDIAMKLAGSSPVPIFLVGGMRSASDAENALEFGIKAVSFCRPFICDRDFAFNLLRGKRSECIGCNKCFSDVKCHAKEQAVRS